MLCTLISTRPTPDTPPFSSFDDRRPHIPDRRDDREDREARCQVQDEEDPDFPPNDRRIQAGTLRLDFPCFDGDNPFGWSYKVNKFFDYY